MSTELLLSLAIALCFTIQSIFGFAGYVLSASIIASVYDAKFGVALGVAVAFFANVFILFSDLKSISWPLLRRIFLTLTPGIFLGAYIFGKIEAELMQKLFGIFTMLYAGFISFRPTWSVAEKWKNFVNLIGGVFVGIFGQSSIIMMLTMRDKFKNKSEMRSTFVSFYLTISLILVPHHVKQGVISWEEFKPFIWTIPLVLITTWIGFHIHKKMPDKYFRIGVAILLFTSGVRFLW